MDKQTVNKHMKLPFIVTLAGVLILVIALFLPYMTAVGDMAEYIEEHPDRVEIESLDLTASDLANIPVVSVSSIITGVYGEDDGQIANIIVIVLCSFTALTALFVVLKKPIAAIIFDLFNCGTFAFLNFLMSEDFIDADKYAWGIGYYAIMVAIVAVFVGAIWLLVKKIITKKQLKAQPIPSVE